jgi:shikimate kinase
MRRSGFVVWLRTDVARQLQRLRADGSRPLLMAPDREQRLTEMAAQRNPLYREVADLIFESAQAHVGVASDRLARVLQRRWQPLHPATPSTSSTSGPPSP